MTFTFKITLVDGMWTMWSGWNTCSATCGGGDQNRTRKCEGQTNGGAPCTGSDIDSQDCGTNDCPGE